MRLTSSSFVLVLSFVLSVVSFACGGKVVVDAPTSSGNGGSGGAAGTGGATQSSTTSSPDTSSAFVSSSVVTSSAVVSVVSSTSTGTGSACDNQGNCQDPSGSSCVQCAVDGECADALNTCMTDDQCFQFNDCQNNCGGDAACQQGCAQKFPSGAMLFQELIACIVCKVCINDCMEFSAGFCP